MNALELADQTQAIGFMTTTAAAAMLRKQHEAIRQLREALREAELVLEEKLRRLGADPRVSPTPHRIRAALAAIIGNTSWAEPKTCHECGEASWDVVQVGEEPDSESATALICVHCLRKATALVTGEKT